MSIALESPFADAGNEAPKRQATPATAFSIRESKGYFRHSSRNEAIIRFVGTVIILGGFVQWLTPEGFIPNFWPMPKLGLGVAFSIVGIAIYTFAMRGYRIEMAFDPVRRKISVRRLDRRDGVRSTEDIALRNIKSIYVLKASTPGSPSKMRLKLYDRPEEVTILRGTYQDVELAHRQLCHNIKLAQH
ncbi:hypothetical protein [Shimia sp.]|uniref:hypothetical protein n=1 Tax=Shimia sp. TaxID=1954381 RepID=UPI0035634902